MSANIEDATVSIVMPCYNCADTLAASAASAMGQTHRKLELVLVDDGSRDGTPQVIEALARDDERVVPCRQDNTGPAAARNHGLRRATGDFVAFLDSDDHWEPDFLESMLQPFAMDESIVLTYCGWQNLGVAGGRGEPFVPPEYESENKLEVFLTGCRWPIHAALTRRRVIEDVGLFDESLAACMDFDLWLRIATQSRIARVPKVLAYYVHHAGEQITKDRVRVALNHFKSQTKYLRENDRTLRTLDRSDRRRILYGELLHRGYQCYWDRDLPAARTLFRKVMRAGYGTSRDWKYMLPSLLPLPLHAALLKWMSRTA